MDVNLPDGRTLRNVPEGTTKAQIAEKLGLDMPTAPAPIEQPAQQQPQQTQEKQPGFFGRMGQNIKGAWQGTKQGITLGFGDEIQSAIAASVAAPLSDLTWTEAYDMALGDFRADTEKARTETPIAYYPGEIAGAVALPMGAVSSGGKAISGLLKGSKITRPAGELLGKAITLGGEKLATGMATKPLRTAAAVGGGAGAAYGFGIGEGGLEERAKSAGIGGITGATVGPAGAYVGSKAAKLADFFKPTGTKGGGGKLANIGKRSLEEIADQTETAAKAPKGTQTTQKKAIDKVVGALKKDFPDDWKEVLEAWQKGGDPLSKVYGSRIGSLGKGSAQYPSGKATAEDFFGEQIASAPERIKSAISKNISDKDLYFATVDDVVEAGRSKAAPLYDEAYKANKTVISNEVNKILSTPAGRKALKDTAKVMQNDRSLMGLPDKELKAITRDLVAVGKMDDVAGPIAKGLNLRTLDAVKKDLDDQIGKLCRAGDKYEGGVLTILNNALVKSLDEADTTGAYAKARSEAGDYLSATKAMDNGKNFMKQDPELLRKSIKGMDSAERDAFKIGVGKQVRDMIDKTLDGSNPYNRIFGSTQAKERLYAVLGPDEFINLEKSLKAENRLFKLRNETLGGSPTTSKAIAAAEIASGAGDVAMALSTGSPKAVGLKAITGMVSKTFDGLNDDMADAVARLLYETNPEKKLMLIKSAVGDKKFTEAEKQIIKKAYFMAEDAVKARTRGATWAAVSASLVSGAKEGM